MTPDPIKLLMDVTDILALTHKWQVSIEIKTDLNKEDSLRFVINHIVKHVPVSQNSFPPIVEDGMGDLFPKGDRLFS